MSHVEDINKWLANVMPRIIENLGPKVDEAEYELSDANASIMSTMCFVRVKFKNRTNGQSEELPIVLKRPVRDESMREIICSDEQFNNEITFYQIYRQPDENFPKCFYAYEQPPVDSVIALENVSERGYHPCPYKYDVPLDYTFTAMRELGRLHGKGYVMKERQPKKFFDIVRRLKRVRFGIDNTSTDKKFGLYVNFVSTRAVDYLRDRGHDAIFCDKMEALLSNIFEEVMIKTLEKSKSAPLSTLCHGDFTVANMLFKTDANGQHRAMLLDFAFFMYATPVVDLSTYICLYCSYEVIKDRFFEILKVYHDALKEYLLEAGVRNIECYSYEALLDDYRSGGLFGFGVASFYLVVLRGVLPLNSLSLFHHDVMKFAQMFKAAGGDELSKILADMLLQMRDLGLKDVL